MDVIGDIGLMQSRSNELRAGGRRIGFVPTMGALHEGHLSLVDISKKNSSVTIMSIYLNPTQFAANEDISKYPADLDRDLELAKERGVDIVFCPTNEIIYPKKFETYVEVTNLTKNLCGASRPTHFKGVTTVVLKLFNIVRPHVAIFGTKDYQQFRVIEQMVKDLNLQIQIIGAPIVREADGLAMSSRNQNLTPEERLAATSISESIEIVSKAIESGEKEAKTLVNLVKKHIESTNIGKIDYIKFCNPESLEDLRVLEAPSLLAIAAHFGEARLIDNSIMRLCHNCLSS